MKLVIVEDDYQQAQSLASALTARYRANVEQISTEHAFMVWLDSLKVSPDAAIIDVMLRWATPSDDMPEPPERVVKEGYYRAGLRCVERLRQRPITATLPAILYTVLQAADLADEHLQTAHLITHISKESDPEELFSALDSALKSRRT